MMKHAGKTVQSVNLHPEHLNMITAKLWLQNWKFIKTYDLENWAKFECLQVAVYSLYPKSNLQRHRIIFKTEFHSLLVMG
jgi:hypothetical protein